MSRPEHPIFRGPVPVTLALEQTPTPPGYRSWTLDEMPPTLPTLAILERASGPDVERAEGEAPPTPGLVTSGDGFEDTPDAEIIAGGIHHKGPNYGAIARQGRLLQWGFFGTPEEMTEAGRAVFLNALHYVTKFRDEPIVGFRDAESRDDVATTIALLDEIEPERRDAYLRRELGDAVPAEARGDRAARQAWFVAARPYLRFDAARETFAIDEDARALGIANDDVALLRRSVEDLEAGREPERARRLLERYTDRRFATAGEWRAWLDANASRLRFSDVAGYRFRTPDESKVPLPAEAPTSADAVSIEIEGWKRDGKVSARMVVRVAPGYHVYAPSTKEPHAIKLAVSLPEGSPLRWRETPSLPAPPRGTISGRFAQDLALEGDTDQLSLLATYQACSEKACLLPVTGQVVTAKLEGD